MKRFHILILSLAFFGCLTVPPVSDLSTIKIVEIDSKMLSQYHLIKFRYHGNEGVILSEKNNEIQCGNQIRKDQKLKILLSRMSTFKISETTSMRLYVSDYFVDNKLVLPKNIIVYSSTNLLDLCIN